MKITRRQLRRIIEENLDIPPDKVDYLPNHVDELEDRLNAVWDVVGADTLDVLGGQATWEEIADEVLASGYSIDPDLVETINLLPFVEQQRLFQRVFGKGRRR